MFLPLIRKIPRAISAAGAALVLCSAFNVSIAAAQRVSAAPVPDHSQIEEVLNGLNRGRAVGQVAVAPDGKRLAWTEGSEIRVAPLDDLAKSERVTAAARPDQHCHEGGIAWRPDSKALGFFSDCAGEDEQADLYLSRLDGSPAHRLAKLRGAVDAPAFSPDGTKVAFLYVEGATRRAGALAAMKPPSGVIGEDGVEIQRVAVAAADSDTPAVPAMATPANLHVYEFDWSPDSKFLAYVAAEPPGENNWWVAKLYTGELGGAAKAILAPAEIGGPLHGLQIAVPRWSPDGKAIAFIGGLMSDQGATGGDVWIISAGAGQPAKQAEPIEPINLTPQRPTSPAWIEWADNEHIYVSELAGGNSQLVRFRLQGDRASESVAASFGAPIFSIPGSVGDGRMELSLSSTANHSMFVFGASTFDHPPEIYAAKPGVVMSPGLEGAIQLSHFNDGVEAGWGKPVSMSWKVAPGKGNPGTGDPLKNDSFRVQGWLMLPKDYDPARKYPLIVEVHGGPASAVVAHWGGGGGLSPVAFSALGYFVLQPNPRGSFGEGEAFTQANRKDFGYGDLLDILAGVDAVEAKYPVDPGRVGITGWSYGGFMTMFAVTQTGRFKAAVAGAGLSNWQSYYGENSIDQWMIPYFGASVYDDPAVYARSSAINFIKQAHTPTLVVVGDRDGECPAPQSYEFWHALRDQHVPTQLVVYPNEGHGFLDPAHRRDVLERAVEWFERYMSPGD
jgi:dipeptidyl aminopeptidase/acylaminoacyl peptidase